MAYISKICPRIVSIGYKKLHLEPGVLNHWPMSGISPCPSPCSSSSSEHVHRQRFFAHLIFWRDVGKFGSTRGVGTNFVPRSACRVGHRNLAYFLPNYHASHQFKPQPYLPPHDEHHNNITPSLPPDHLQPSIKKVIDSQLPLDNLWCAPSISAMSSSKDGWWIVDVTNISIDPSLLSHKFSSSSSPTDTITITFNMNIMPAAVNALLSLPSFGHTSSSSNSTSSLLTSCCRLHQQQLVWSWQHPYYFIRHDCLLWQQCLKC